MIVLSARKMCTKMIILFLSTAVSLSIQAAVPVPTGLDREFNFLLDSPTITEAQANAANESILTTTTVEPEAVTTEPLLLVPTLPKLDTTETNIEQVVTEQIFKDEITSEDPTTESVMLEQSTILDNAAILDESAMFDDSAILNSDYSEDDYSFMLTNRFIKNRQNQSKPPTKNAMESENTATEQVIETATEQVIKNENPSTEQVNDFEIPTAEELTTVKDIIEETTVEKLESTTDAIIENETSSDNEQSVTTENNEDTTLDISLAFKDVVDELAAIEKEVDMEEAELTTEEDSAIVFTNESENNDSSFYDTFEDGDYTITKNEQLGTTTSEKPTKSSFGAIMFTKDGIEPLDDSAFVLTNTHLMAALNDDAVIFTTDSLPALYSEGKFTTDSSFDSDSEQIGSTHLPQEIAEKIELKIPQMNLETPSTKAPSNINDYVMTFFDMDIPKMPHQHQNKDENEHEIQTTSEASISPVIIVKIPDLDMEKVNKEDTIVDGFVTSTKVDIEDQKEEKNDNDYVDYYQDEKKSSFFPDELDDLYTTEDDSQVEEEIPKIESALIEKALADYDFSYTNNEDITTVRSAGNVNEVDSGVIIDVLKNFISEQDPILELFLSVCFVHPDCFQLDSPFPTTELGAQGREILHLLQARRSETARVALLTKIDKILIQVKEEMFQAIEEEVSKRGVSLAATKNIIDSIKHAWEDIRDDLQYAISSLHEIFSSTILLENQDMYTGIAQIAETLNRIPEHAKKVYSDAAQNGYTRYQQFSAWNSWKRQPKQVNQDQ